MMKLLERWNSQGVGPDDFDTIRKVEKEPKYVLLDGIGDGATAKVHRARRRSALIGGFEYAIKLCSLPDEAGSAPSTKSNESGEAQRCRIDASQKAMIVTLETCKAEVSILRLLQLPRNRHVVHAFDCFEYDNQVWMVMEHLPLDLEHMLWLRKKEGEDCLGVGDGAVYIREIARGLQFIHSRRVVHKDLKPGNIMLSNLGNVKLCDFGLSKQIPLSQQKLIVERKNGTPQYMASELFAKGNEYDYSVDIWALGIILHNLCHNGNPLVQNQFRNKLFGAYNKSFYHYIHELCDGCGRVLTAEQTEIVYSVEVAATEKLSYDLPYAPFRDFIFGTLVPYPSGGTKTYPVTRQVTEKRMTLDEVFEWAEKKLAGRSELDCRNLVIQHVRECLVMDKEIQARIRRAKEIGGEEGKQIIAKYYPPLVSVDPFGHICGDTTPTV